MSTSRALFTAMESSARAVEQQTREPAAQELAQRDSGFARMTGELMTLLGSLEEDWKRGLVSSREEHRGTPRPAPARAGRISSGTILPAP
ncbi:hypothetical protein [Streptomyces sp. NPDC058307]|uniref:hypothetical protein n=1 Tax=Streptomyces sp. NPDC058307 TaxID=3346439 RepID=UPI0036EA47B0